MVLKRMAISLNWVANHFAKDDICCNIFTGRGQLGNIDRNLRGVTQQIEDHPPPPIKTVHMA